MTRTHVTRGSSRTTVEAPQASAEDAERMQAETDAVLDEIDAVLEDAAETLANFRQRGGQ